MTQNTLFVGGKKASAGPVECLGMRFEHDEARREHFRERLREKLRDPEFRKTPGFPIGSDEDILRLSDPPYFTACPNPFLEEFVRHHGRPYNPDEEYHRDPFAVDVSVGKTDQLYKAHGYHTKVPHLAIVPSILHYTKPGDLVLDGFAGSGMTGVATQWCGTAPAGYRSTLEAEWKAVGRSKPEWGARRVVLGDLSPAATFISAGYNLPFDVGAFEREARRILREVEAEIGWMYKTMHTDGKTEGRINFTVWSEVFSCPECAGEVVFVEEALDTKTKRVRDRFPCPRCSAELTKDNLQRLFETSTDPATGKPWSRIRLEPVLINYKVAGKTYEKGADPRDWDVLRRVAELPLPSSMPVDAFPVDEMSHGSRIAPKGFTHVHHFFLPRQRQALASLWGKASAVSDSRTRNALLFFAEQAIWGMSVLNRYSPSHFSQVNRQLNGVYYVASQCAEVSPWYILDGKLSRLVKAFSPMPSGRGAATVTTGDCATLLLSDACVDYVFTDPPFGENIYYADLNFLVEAWHQVITDAEPEAIVDQAKRKGVHEYQDLMRRCFEEYHRILKPGRWMTVVFSNSSNAIWRAIQEAMGTAGFVVADVRTLDKQVPGFKGAIGQSVKQDLIISAYKPTTALSERFALGSATTDDVWAFVTEHLSNVTISPNIGADATIIAERTSQMLFDRMIAFFVQRGIAVPIGAREFFEGLAQRYPVRDEMYFVPAQVPEYERIRGKRDVPLKQLDLFVTDEASAIEWVRRQLEGKPQTLPDLTPAFIQEVETKKAWAKHEQTVELRKILEQNFLRYDGTGPVPSQIHAYLSNAYRDMRNLDKTDPRLMEKARDRWYVPDPSKQAEREKIRERNLLKEFEEYKSTKKKLKQFRTEAVRAGFKAAYDKQDYRTITDVAHKLPESVLQEDEKLLMYYDVASMRLGT
jgi:DNA modification methylase